MSPRRPVARLAAVALAAVLGTTLAGCGSDKAKPAPSASPSVAPYVDVPGDVHLTDPGSSLKVGQHAVVAWKPRQDTVAVLDIQVTRLERTTFDKSFQGWNITRNQAATTPYFARAVATNVSDTDLGSFPVPLWGQDDAARLIGAQPFDQRVFQPCHPAKLPATFKPGAKVDLCFVFLMSPGYDFTSATFEPQDADGAALAPITWTGKIQTKVKPPTAPKKKSTSKKSGTSKKSTKKTGKQ